MTQPSQMKPLSGTWSTRPNTTPLHLLSPPHIKLSLRTISTTPPKTPPETPSANTSPSTSSPPSNLPHLTATSEIHLISTSAKTITHRQALAIGHVRFSNPDPLRLIREHGLKKGDVLAVARVAGIQAVKNTSTIIPLAHPGVPVEGCLVRVKPVDASQSENSDDPIGDFGGVRISVSVETTAKTGVEMEALAGVMGAALTVVDMCKGLDKSCEIGGVKVVGKRGGRSGDWGVWEEKDGDVEEAELEDRKGLED